MGPNVWTVKNQQYIMALAALLAGVCALGGCEGEYILTVPDQIARIGETANVVIRVERYEVGSLRMDIEGAPIRLQVGDLTEHGAFTDEMGFTGLLTDAGYAGTAVEVPKKEGRYVLKVSLQDDLGDEAYAEAPLYVWPHDVSVTAVDLDALPRAKDVAAVLAKDALDEIAKTSRLVYFTQNDVGDNPTTRGKITGCGYPEGPLFTWRRSYTHYVRTGKLRLPRRIIESRLVMHLGYLRKLFPGLKTGVCTTEAAAREFARVGIRPVIVGPVEILDLNTTRRVDWPRLKQHGAGQ